jgi:hypothetical protein
MRYWLCFIAAATLLTAPAAAQPASSDSKTASSAPQNQAAKDGKTAAAQPAKTPQPAKPAVKDDSIVNYDVNGSNASDAMGGAP